jgi:uncharacterized protein (TIGR02266 family)
VILQILVIEREHQRVPFAVAVQFRSASSFLIAYSVNLSRGGLFLETMHDLPIGTPLDLSFEIPGAGSVGLGGTVAWRRGPESPEGPSGLGVEFYDISAQLSSVIDQLVGGYQGMQLLIVARDNKDRTSLSRMLKSIVSSAEILLAADAAVAETLLTDDVDLAIIDLDSDPEGGLAAIRLARSLATPVPAIALASTKRLRDHARAAGADELTGNPPAFEELQLAVVRGLSRPVAVR